VPVYLLNVVSVKRKVGDVQITQCKCMVYDSNKLCIMRQFFTVCNLFLDFL
jgi:hypothetical protein